MAAGKIPAVPFFLRGVVCKVSTAPQFSVNSANIIRALEEAQKNLVVQLQIFLMKSSELFPKVSKMESITALQKVSIKEWRKCSSTVLI